MKGQKELRYFQSLIRMARRRGASREDAVDYVYQAYAQLFQYSQTHDVRQEESLLRRIVINLTINAYHRDEKNKWQFVPLSKARHVADLHAGPERILEGEQDLNFAVDILRAISERTKQIFLMHRAGYSYDEIASAFAIKPRTVEKHVDMGATAIEEYFAHGTLLTEKMWLKQW